MPQRIGVLGGTFDPVHIGHLRIGEEVAELLGLDIVLFIPSAAPPHKDGQEVAPFAHRWEMLRMALNGNPRFQLSDIERRMPGKSYSVLTLRKLREEFKGNGRCFFLVGLDAFLELHTWWRFQELFRLASLVVLPRPGFDPAFIEGFLTREVSREYTRQGEGTVFVHPSLLPVRCLSCTELGVSSTQIRRLVRQGRSIRYLVVPEVMRYIHANGLYREVF
ncbi:MAG: nicotinate (nicotinamide) nucleotide adenylyltransferase [Deltaproteobacteria bacterium]|nr:nicotinate (nicotinamide) nucleotide adenylyltransferase [Deltaproteobacteria bacterium]